MELFKLFGTIDLKDEASKGLDAVDGKAEKTGGLFGKLAKGVGVGAVAIGAAAAGAGAGMFAMAEKAAGTTDRIDKLSQKIGLSREGFQEWDFIMSQSGGSVEGLQMGFKTLVNSVDQAIDGTGKGAESFAALGVSVKDASGNVKDQETIFNESVIALQNMEDGTEKAKLANDLFGRSGAEMMPLLNGAAGSVEAMKEQAHELGLVMGDDAVDAGVVFTDTMDQLKRSFGTAAAEIGVQMMPLITKFADFIIGSMPTIQKVMGAVFDGISIAIGAVVDFISNRVIPVFQSLWDFLEPRLPAIQAAFETAFGFVKTVLAEVVEAIKDLTAWFVEHWALVGPILAGIAAGAIAFQVITTAMKAYKAIMLLVTLAQTKMNLAMLANPIGLVVVAIGLLVTAGILLYKNWDVVKEKLGLFWEKIKEVWTIIVDFVKDAVQRFKDDVTNGFNAVKDFITNTWESIKTFFQVTWEFIKFIFTTVVTAIVDFVKQRFENLKNNISTIFNAIKNFISTVWNGIKSFVSSVVTGIVDFVKQRFENLKNNVSTVFNAIKNFITDTWNRIKSTISNLVEGIKNTVRDKFQAMKDAVSGKMNNVKDSIKNIWDSVMGFFKGINLFSMGKDIIQGLINGIKGMAGSLLSAVKRLVTDNIPGPIKKIMGIASPSKLMHQYGEWTGEGLEEGMVDSAGGIHKASVKLAHAAIPPIMQQFLDKLASMSLLKAAAPKQVASPSTGYQAPQQPITFQSVLDGRVIAESTFDINEQLFGAASTNSAWMKGVKG